VSWLAVVRRGAMWIISMVQLCFPAFTLLLAYAFVQAAATEDDVTPRLSFTYSKCHPLLSFLTVRIAVVLYGNIQWIRKEFRPLDFFHIFDYIDYIFF
jgi:hypothetical protein